MSREVVRLLFASGAALAVASCGSSDNTDNDGAAGSGAASGAGANGGSVFSTGGSGADGAGANGASGSGASGSGAGGSGANGDGGTTSGGGPITSVTPVSPDDACATQTLQAMAGVLDVFIMLDRSGSMDDSTAAGPTKWDAITEAINTFVSDPSSAGIGAGLGFFGIGDGDNPSCDASDYADAVVPIAPLNGNAGPISDAISNQTPDGYTPTEPALEGALDYAAAWAEQNPTHTVIVVLATDGAPNGCDSTPEGAASIAENGYTGTPSIPTYVIGVVGEGEGDGNCEDGPVPSCEFVETLNGIAEGGGTTSAFIVNTSNDPGAQFLAALNAIRNANQVGCDFAVPAPSGGETLDFSRATVEYTPGGGTAESLAWSATASGCSGWHYNSVTAPNQIQLCDGVCQTVMADPNAQIDVLLGCLPPGSGGAGGAGGTTGTGGAGGSASCLLPGQSCSDTIECCIDVCTNGVCPVVIM